jgi:hypothetical protein
MARLAASVALLLPLIGIAAAPAAEKPPDFSRAVAFHAEDLRHPLLALRGGVMVLQECEVRLREKCSAAQREAAAAGQWTLRLLDTLTLFPENMSRDPAAPAVTYDQMRERLSYLREEQLIATQQYDKKLFARFGAALRICPPEKKDEYQEYLANMKDLDLRVFGGLTIDKFALELAAIDKDEVVLAGKLKAWPTAECINARRVGHELLNAMYSKLEPWMEKKPPEDQDFARGVTEQFLLSAAARLEFRVNAATKEKWREIGKERTAAKVAP